MYRDLSDTSDKSPMPPFGGSGQSEGKCKHKYKHLETNKTYARFETYSECSVDWKRVDIFYCENCLEFKNIVQTACYTRNKPDWF